MMEASREKSGIKGSVEDVGIVSSTPMIRLSVQLIGAMCEGQYTVMQVLRGKGVFMKISSKSIL